jgi:hypothetical protein
MSTSKTQNNVGRGRILFALFQFTKEKIALLDLSRNSVKPILKISDVRSVVMLFRFCSILFLCKTSNRQEEEDS